MKNLIYAMAYVSLIGICLVMTPSLLHAQELQAAAQHEESISEQISESTKKVDGWNRQANILITLTILVAFFGAVIVVIQAYNNKLCKISTSIFGIVISVITAVNTLVFPTDHRTLKYNVTEGRKYIRQMKLSRINFNGAPDEINKRAFLQKISEAIHELDKLEQKMFIPTVSLNILPMAYAQPTQPAWVSKSPPTDNMNFYAVGTGEDAYLEKAEENSVNAAVGRIVELVSEQFKSQKMAQPGAIRSDALREYIKKPSEIVDTYVKYDAHTKVYKCFALLRLNKKFVEPKFIAAFSSRVIDYAAVKVVEKTTMEQRHRKILGNTFQDGLAVYIGDIHDSKPFTLVIFQDTVETAEWQDSTRIAIGDFKKIVQKENILFEGEIDPRKIEVNFSYHNQNYALFGTVRSQFLTDYFDFEVFRKTR